MLAAPVGSKLVTDEMFLGEQFSGTIVLNNYVTSRVSFPQKRTRLHD
jgi:hypothetical protein